MENADDDYFWDRVSPRAVKVIRWYEKHPDNIDAIWDDPYEFLDPEVVQKHVDLIRKYDGVDIDSLPD